MADNGDAGTAASESSWYTLRSDMEEKIRELPGGELIAALFKSPNVRDVPVLEVRPVNSMQAQACDLSARVVLVSGRRYRLDVTELDGDG